MITLREYANKHNISYEAVRKQVEKYHKDLKGHIVKKGNARYLDEKAEAFLDKKRSTAPVIVYEAKENVKDKQIDNLKREVDDLRKEITKLQNNLISSRNQVIEVGQQLIEAREELLEETRKRAALEMAAVKEENKEEPTPKKNADKDAQANGEEEKKAEDTSDSNDDENCLEGLSEAQTDEKKIADQPVDELTSEKAERGPYEKQPKKSFWRRLFGL